MYIYIYIWLLTSNNMGLLLKLWCLPGWVTCSVFCRWVALLSGLVWCALFTARSPCPTCCLCSVLGCALGFWAPSSLLNSPVALALWPFPQHPCLHLPPDQSCFSAVSLLAWAPCPFSSPRLGRSLSLFDFLLTASKPPLIWLNINRLHLFCPIGIDSSHWV